MITHIYSRKVDFLGRERGVPRNTSTYHINETLNCNFDKNNMSMAQGRSLRNNRLITTGTSINWEFCVFLILLNIKKSPYIIQETLMMTSDVTFWILVLHISEEILLASVMTQLFFSLHYELTPTKTEL